MRLMHQYAPVPQTGRGMDASRRIADMANGRSRTWAISGQSCGPAQAPPCVWNIST